MTSWGGTSMVTVLRSILTILSTRGRRMKSPGPLGPPCTLPRLKITPRSYSLTTLMALSTTEATNSARITTTITANPIPTACNKPNVSYTRDPPLSWPVEIPATTGQLDRHYLHYSSISETHHAHLASLVYCGLKVSWVGLFGGESKHGAPQLAVHEHPPFGVHPHGAPYGANLADHPLLARKSRRPSAQAQRTQDPEEHTPHEHRDDHDCAEQHTRVGDAGPKEHQAPGKERHDAPRDEQAMVRYAQVHDEEYDPNEDQDHPDRRGYHRNSALWPANRYTNEGSIVARNDCTAHVSTLQPPAVACLHFSLSARCSVA